MSVSIEALKRMNLVDFLTEHYGVNFKRKGSGYVAGSPFGTNRRPGFFVRQLDNRWLFKDFSSGVGGSSIDVVRHLECLSGVGDVLKRREDVIGDKTAVLSRSSIESSGEAPKKGEHGSSGLIQGLTPTSFVSLSEI